MKAAGRMSLVMLAVSLPAPVFAHDLWLESAPPGLVLRYGHHGGELLALDPAKVKAARCRNQGATTSLLQSAAFAQNEVRFTGPCGSASASFDGGYYSLTPDGEVNLPKNQVAQAVKAWASRQFAKWVEVQSPDATIALGDELEIVPLGDLAKVHQGDKVSVRVLYQGKPAANVVVAIDHKALGETDRAGDARIKVRASDIETISATLRQVVATPEADSVVLEASLSFRVAK